MKISVFGGSQPKSGDQSYLEAKELGKILAQRGHTVLTGGYIGTMEAVSRGAAEAGGQVIGVTCEDLERWRPVSRNKWVQEEWRKQTLFERLQALIENCDAAFALPGGPGTLTEIALTWNLMIIQSLPVRPLILIGNGWEKVFDQLFTSMESYVSNNQRELLVFAPDVTSALNKLDEID
ncbi:MAG: hypothetical protein A2Y54_00590 [Chloroflexi bacterium RBG_16_51_16]|nr:MAG: hypothetical protein A2Y54_00590 [Chloroflexi bacterium RBG_16_51_16]